MIKSPLRYPGGKTRAVKTIVRFIPDNITSLCSPFLGGGSVELHCVSKGIKVSGYDVFSPLTDFWQCLLNNPGLLADEIQRYHPLQKQDFYNLQKTLTDHPKIYERAAIFYVLNRASFSGTSLSGGMSPGHPRFNQASIDRVRNFKAPGLVVEQSHFQHSITNNKSDFIFLDPPYLIASKLYGTKGSTHKDFDHQTLAEILYKTDTPWLLCYNDCEEIREMYKLYNIYTPTEWKYGMNKSKKSSEVLVTNAKV